MAEWREVILNGVNEVVFPRAIPGTIAVYGESFHPIITNKFGQVLCAAGEVGNGRIVVLSHSRFIADCHSLTENGLFCKNIKFWLTRGSYEDDSEECEVVDISKVESISDIPRNNKICSWTTKNLPDNEIDKMVKWLEEGGALVCGACTWGYLQLHPGKEISDMPLSRLFQAIGGLVFVGGTKFKHEGHETKMSENKAACARLDVICKEAINNIEFLGTISAVLKHLPDNICDCHKQNITELLDTLETDTHCIPTKENLISTDRTKRIAKLRCDMLIYEGMKGNAVVAPGINHFPGIFSTAPKLENVKLRIHSTCKKYHATGCYLPAGTVMGIDWNSRNQWNVFVGLHTDKLKMNKRTWSRWPRIIVKKAMKSSPMKICSPFGGLVYLESPPNASEVIDVTLNDVVPAPVFTYETAKEWTSSHIQKPGLWCDIIGDKISFIMPSRAVRNLTDLTQTMKVWDSVVDAHIELRGCDPSLGRGQIVIADQQLQWGYMHAGYPICTHLDVSDCDNVDGFLLYGEKVKRDGKWGLFHELGHNFQDKLWTWDGTNEVTVNIFTLHAMDVICNKSPWIHPWLKKHMNSAESYLKDGADIDKWRKSPGIALIVYAQLARDFGWDAYKTIFLKYNLLPKRKHPKTRAEKESQWIKLFSKIVKRNLCPLFEFWGWSIADRISAKLKKFVPYLPNDETTEIAPDRARIIATKYGCEFPGVSRTKKEEL
ncbi:TRPM8 channel-associated factor homolog [Tubulanus polymorphus]|uniref:TRPM8 channel-associated factor homolog n=1 Tax=Tubulanus polymorphus TaxID=672921 RepID=UPI003DA4FBA7